MFIYLNFGTQLGVQRLGDRVDCDLVSINFGSFIRPTVSAGPIAEVGSQDYRLLFHILVLDKSPVFRSSAWAESHNLLHTDSAIDLVLEAYHSHILERLVVPPKALSVLHLLLAQPADAEVFEQHHIGSSLARKIARRPLECH